MNNLVRDAITENLKKYFSSIRDMYKGPISMLYAVEILLSDDKLQEADFLLELQDQSWGGSKIEGYIEHLNDRTLPNCDPVFMVELSAIRRWNAISYFPAEVFWAQYLGRMTGISDHRFSSLFEEAVTMIEAQSTSRRMGSAYAEIVSTYMKKVIAALSEVS